MELTVEPSPRVQHASPLVDLVFATELMQVDLVPATEKRRKVAAIGRGAGEALPLPTEGEGREAPAWRGEEERRWWVDGVRDAWKLPCPPQRTQTVESTASRMTDIVVSRLETKSSFFFLFLL
jgi:hypothetical protein